MKINKQFYMLSAMALVVALGIANGTYTSTPAYTSGITPGTMTWKNIEAFQRQMEALRSQMAPPTASQQSTSTATTSTTVRSEPQGESQNTTTTQPATAQPTATTQPATGQPASTTPPVVGPPVGAKKGESPPIPTPTKPAPGCGAGSCASSPAGKRRP